MDSADETLPGLHVRNLMQVSCVRLKNNIFNLRNQIQVKRSFPGPAHVERGPFGRTENDPFILLYINPVAMSGVLYNLPVGLGEVQGGRRSCPHGLSSQVSHQQRCKDRTHKTDKHNS